MVVLIPYHNVFRFVPKPLGFADFVDDGIGKGNTAAGVLDEIVFLQIRPGKCRALLVEEGRSGEVHKGPEESIREFTIIAVHVLGVEENKSHIEVIVPISEVHSSIGVYLYMRKRVRRMVFLNHFPKQPRVVASGDIDISIAHRGTDPCGVPWAWFQKSGHRLNEATLSKLRGVRASSALQACFSLSEKTP